VVNLDPNSWQEATMWLDVAALGFEGGSSLDVHDEMTGESYTWTGNRQYVRLDPAVVPGHVFHVRSG